MGRRVFNQVRIIGAAVFVLAVVAPAVVYLWPRPGVTQANLDRIEDGMTLEEVEEIFGRPAGLKSQHTPGTNLFQWYCPSGETTSIWISDEKGVLAKDWPEADETIVRKVHKWIFPRPKVKLPQHGPTFVW